MKLILYINAFGDESSLVFIPIIPQPGAFVIASEHTSYLNYSIYVFGLGIYHSFTEVF